MTGPPPKPEVSPAAFVEHAERYQQFWICGHLRELLDRLNVTSVWDVGANTGQYGNLLRSLVGYDGPLVSFEPVSQAYERLSERAERDDLWTAFKLALGSRDEERQIRVTENALLSSFLDPSDYGVQALGRMTGTATQEVVPVRTMDSVMAGPLGEIPTDRIFLKLDTQGWDLEVIRGAEGSLAHVVGLQTEVCLKPIYEGMPSFAETIEYVESRGFDLSGVFPVIRDEQMRMIELDCVFVRPDEISPRGHSGG